MTSDGYSVPDVNLAEYQMDRMRLYGNSTALVVYATASRTSYADVVYRIQRLAAGLRDLELGEGDVVCMLTHNHIDYPVVWYAANMIGATLQTASPGYTDADLLRRFQQCRPQLLVTTIEQGKRIKDLIHLANVRDNSFRKPNLLKQIIVIDGEAPGFVGYKSLFTNARVTKATRVNTRTSNALLLSSSGTTGLPKNVRLTHENIVANLPQLHEVCQHRPGQVGVVCLPMYHHYGLHTVLAGGLYSGIKMVVMEKFNFQQLLELIPKYKIEILPMVPPISVRLVKLADKSLHDFSSVNFIQNAAAPLGIEIEKQLLQMFNIKYITQVYGLTETGMNTGNKPTKYRAGSSGVVPRGVDLKIVDPETGRTLEPNQTGEILVRGPIISAGYLNEPDITKKAFDADGYFKTGDLGYLDADGFLFVVDRLKELIKYKGLQVAPAFLEDLLMKHPDVADSAVIGLPDPETGELPRAFIVKQPNSSVTEQQIYKYVEDHVASHMRLRGGVIFISQIPKSPSGKILRRLLRKQTTKAKL